MIASPMKFLFKRLKDYKNDLMIDGLSYREAYLEGGGIDSDRLYTHLDSLDQASYNRLFAYMDDGQGGVLRDVDGGVLRDVAGGVLLGDVVPPRILKKKKLKFFSLHLPNFNQSSDRTLNSHNT